MSAVNATRRHGLAEIELNRPHRLNAINSELLEMLEKALSEANSDPHVRVILLRSRGESFCVGDDLQELGDSELTRDDIVSGIRRLQNITRLIALGPKIVVCAVQGWAVGAGASWPLNADICVWREDSKIRLPEAGYGLFVSGGMSYLLPSSCGMQKAMETMLFGDALDAHDLFVSGIATEIVDQAKFDTVIKGKVNQLLDLPDASLVRYKRNRTDKIRDGLLAALDTEEAELIEATMQLVAERNTPSLVRPGASS